MSNICSDFGTIHDEIQITLANEIKKEEDEKV